MMPDWQDISTAPRNTPVMTKIADAHGSRNEQPLKLGDKGRLWWLTDGSMYVYYEPTHWRPIPPATENER